MTCLLTWRNWSPLRLWHAMWLQRIDTKIAAVRERKEERERGA